MLCGEARSRPVRRGRATVAPRLSDAGHGAQAAPRRSPGPATPAGRRRSRLHRQLGNERSPTHRQSARRASPGTRHPPGGTAQPPPGTLEAPPRLRVLALSAPLRDKIKDRLPVLHRGIRDTHVRQRPHQVRVAETTHVCPQQISHPAMLPGSPSRRTPYPLTEDTRAPPSSPRGAWCSRGSPSLISPLRRGFARSRAGLHEADIGARVTA